MLESTAPRAGGLARLRIKLDESDRRQRGELRALTWAAAVLIVVCGSLLISSERIGYEHLHEKTPAGEGTAVEVPVNTPGVRFLWVM